MLKSCDHQVKVASKKRIRISQREEIQVKVAIEERIRISQGEGFGSK